MSLALSKPFDEHSNGCNTASRTWPTLSYIPTPMLLLPMDGLLVQGLMAMIPRCNITLLVPAPASPQAVPVGPGPEPVEGVFS